MLVLTDDDAKTVQNVVHSLQVLETISPVITNNDITTFKNGQISISTHGQYVHGHQKI